MGDASKEENASIPTNDEKEKVAQLSTAFDN